MPNEMSEWAQLYRRRWQWQDNAMEAFYRELGTEHHDVPVGGARIMLVGNAQVGKTTLLLRLLGVCENAEEVEQVLRAGREVGESSTAVPTRYQWGPNADKWFIAGPGNLMELAGRNEAKRLLAGYRTGDGGVRWRIEDRPLVVGIPTRFGSAARRDQLKVFDLPGLNAADPREQAAASRLVAAYAPQMTLVLFVMLVGNLAEMLNDPAITGSPHLSRFDPRRCRIVFTHAFQDENIRRQVADCPGDADTMVAKARTLLADELYASYPDSRWVGTNRDALLRSLFPVEIGTSWARLQATDRHYADSVRAANEFLLDELARTVEEESQDDRRRLALKDAAYRVIVDLEDRKHDRALRLESLKAHVEDAADAVRQAMEESTRRNEATEEAARRLDVLREADKHLRNGHVDYKRPCKPLMKGKELPAAQDGEWKRWVEAAERCLENCAEQFGLDLPFPIGLATAIRDHYRSLVDCCGRCTTSWWRQNFQNASPPEHCYRKMTGAQDGMEAWIREQLASALEKPLHEAQTRFDAAQDTAVRAAAVHRRAVAQADRAREEHRGAQVQGKADAAADAVRKRVAASILTFHNEANQAYVEGLLADRSGGPDARYWRGVAALRALLDLDRVFNS